MKVLLTGASGQLGQALITSRPDGIELIATSRSSGNDQLGLDLADAEACRAAVQLQRPTGCSTAVPTLLWPGPRTNRNSPMR